MNYHDADQERAFGPCPISTTTIRHEELRPIPTLNNIPNKKPLAGTKADAGKVRIELVPPELLFSVAQVLTFGAEKYGDRNWEKGLSWSRVFGALMRHLWCWWAGQGPSTKNFVFGSTDDETGYSHLAHAACCIAFLVSYEERGTGEDDRPSNKG